MPVLNDYLNQMYGGMLTNQGMADNRIDTWGPLARYKARSVYRGPAQISTVPEQVADLPSGNSIEQYFQRQAIDKQGEGDGEWPIVGPVLRAGKVVLDALSAGEYAVASSIREMVDQNRQSDDTNPFTAFFKGLAAGFNDDEEYKTTMYDVLTSMGWDPDTTSGKVGKAVLGFGLSLAVDPLSYTGLGALKAAKAGRFANADIKGIVKEMESVLPSRIKRATAGDQYLTKNVGQKILAHFDKLHKSGISAVDDFEKLTEGVKASHRALEDTARGFLPFETNTWKEAYDLKKTIIGGKEVNTVDETLKALGKPLTDANKEWWITKGYKGALDPGGLKIGIPFTEWEGHIWPNKDIFGSTYLGAIGSFTASAIRNGVPFAGRIEKAVKESPFYKTAIEGYLGTALEKTKQKFQSMRGLSAVDRLVQGEVKKAYQRIIQDATNVADGVISVDGTLAKKRFGAVSMDVASGGRDFLSPGENKFASAVLMDIARHFGEGAMNDLPAWLRKVLIDKPDIQFTQLAKRLGVELTQNTVDRLSSVIPRAQDTIRQLLPIADKIGKKINPLEFWFPFQSAPGTGEIFHTRNGRRAVLADPATFESQTKNMRVMDMLNRKVGFGPGEIAAHPLLDLRENMKRAVSVSLRDAYLHHAFSKFSDISMRHAARVGAKLGREFDPTAMQILDTLGGKKGMQWQLALAESAEGKYAGLSKEQGPIKLWQTLRASTTEKQVEDAISAMKVPAALTDENLKIIRKEWDDTKSLFQEQIAAGNNAKSAVLQKMQDLEVPFFSTLQNAKLETALKAANDRVAQHLATIDITTGKTFGTPQEIADQGVIGNKLQSLSNDVLKKAKSLGISKHIPAMLEKIGFSGSATKATVDDLMRLKDILYSPKPSRVIADVLRRAPDFVKPEMLARINVPSVGNPKHLVPITDYVMDPKMLNELQQFVSPRQMGEISGAIFKGLGFATNQLKGLLTGAIIPGVPRPAFFIRNFIDQFAKRTMGLSSAVGLAKPENFNKAIEIVLGKGGSREFFGVNTDYDVIRRQLETLPNYDAGWGSLGLTKSTIEDLVGIASDTASSSYAIRRQQIMAKLGKIAKAQQAIDPKKLGSLTDNIFIAESLLAHSDRGIAFPQAVENIRKHLFDYSNLTEFEKGLSSIVMFYGFQRQALPWVLGQLAEKPILFNTMARVRDMNWDSPQEEALVPAWVRDYPHIRMEAEDGKIKVSSLRNMFTVDSMADMFPMGVKEFIAKLNPLLTLPVELAIGRDIYLNQDLKETKYVKEQMSKVPEWIPFLNARTVNAADGKDYLAVDAVPWHIMRRTWFSRLFRDADNAAKTISGDFNTWQSMMNFMLGVKLYEYDIEKQMSFIEKAGNEAKSSYNDALRKGDRLRATRILDELRQYTLEP